MFWELSRLYNFFNLFLLLLLLYFYHVIKLIKLYLNYQNFSYFLKNITVFWIIIFFVKKAWSVPYHHMGHQSSFIYLFYQKDSSIYLLNETNGK